MNKDIIKAAITYVHQVFRADASGHDAEHTLRVYRNTVRLAKKVPGCDVELAALAALLHDVDDHKLFQTEGNANARAFLAEYGVSRKDTERVCEIVNSVSFSKNKDKAPETLEGKVVQDADRLDAMGAIGVARTFAYGGAHGRSMESSVKHFYDKLLLLKDLMNTEAGKAMAEERHAFLEEFLREYRKEEGRNRQEEDAKAEQKEEAKFEQEDKA